MKRNEAIARLPVLTVHQQDVRLMCEGDLLGPEHKFWIGPGVAPDRGTEVETARSRRLKAIAAAELVSALARSFVPGENMVAAALDRVCHHVGGEEPTWLVNAPNEAQHALAEEILLAAWESGRIFETMTDFRERLIRDTGAGLHHRVPAGALAGGRVRTTDPVQAARLQRVDVVSFEDIERWENDETLTPESVCRIPQGEKPPLVEHARVDGDDTILSLLPEGGRDDAAPVEVYRFRLGGVVPHLMARVPPLLRPNMLKLQMALSMGVTMEVKNTELMGFAERWLNNVSPPTGEDGLPLPIVTGPGATVFTNDLVATDEESGEVKSLGRASYERLPPVSADPGEAAIMRAREEFYASAHQQHYLMGSDATASGESRKTAMAGFAASLRPYQSAYRQILQELLTLWLRMSVAMAGQPGVLDEVTVEVKLTDRVTSPTPEERAQSLSEWQAGAISHERMLADRGELDPAGEKKQILLEAEERATLQATLQPQRESGSQEGADAQVAD